MSEQMPDQWAAFARRMMDHGLTPPAGFFGDDAAGAGDAPERPAIELPRKGRTLYTVAQELGKVCAEAGYYRSEDNVVIRVDEGQLALREVEAQEFRTDVSASVFLFMLMGREERRRVEETMTVDATRGLLASQAFKGQLPLCQRVSGMRLPVFRKSGALELLPAGYDAESATYTVGGIRIEEGLPLEEARARLDELFGLFPWAEGLPVAECQGYAVQIAAMLSLFCRMLLPAGALRPAFLWTSNERRSGKSLLGKIAAMVSYGKMNSTGFDREDKFSDKITAMAFGGEELCFLDNVKRKLQGESLERLLTSPDWGDRKKGVSEFFSLRNRMWVMITSNHAEASPDMDLRALKVRLFVPEGDPRARKGVPREARILESSVATPAFRGRVLSALWAIVRHWDAEGRPDVGSGAVLRGFEEWSDLIPPMVKLAGLVDPVAVEEGDELDVELRDFRALMGAVAEEMAAERRDEKDFEFADLVNLARSAALFVELIGASDEEGDALKGARSWRAAFARLLKNRQGSRWSTSHGEVRFGKDPRSWARMYIVELVAAE